MSDVETKCTKWFGLRRQLVKMQCFFIHLMTDDSGRYSLSKFILLMAALTGSAIIWKLTIQGKLTLEFFSLYLVFGSGHMLISKNLDIKAGTTQIKSGDQPQ